MTTKPWLAVLGTTPELSALELGVEWGGGQVAELDAEPDIAKLGGTIKVARVVGECTRNLAGFSQLFELLSQLSPTEKLVFGFSVYAGDKVITDSILKQYSKNLVRTGIDWKKKLRTPERSVRYVESKEPALSSVIVTREHLIPQQTDLVLVVYPNTIVLARTTAVQDYKEFSHFDYGRPERDHQSGMLPPKVARMMVNIATQQNFTDKTILDPFCGSGTVLQEALLLGAKTIIGSDLSAKAIADTKSNLEWAKLPVPQLLVCDVLKLAEQIPPQSIDCIVGEGYLGPTHPEGIPKIHLELSSFYQKVIAALPKLLKPNGRVVLAVPSWKRRDGLLTMSLDSTIARAGFTQWHTPISYGREHAQVVRQIYFLQSN